MIFSGVDDLGDRLVVYAQIRRDAVQRRYLSVCRQDRRDDRYAAHPSLERPEGSWRQGRFTWFSVESGECIWVSQ